MQSLFILRHQNTFYREDEVAFLAFSWWIGWDITCGLVWIRKPQTIEMIEVRNYMDFLGRWEVDVEKMTDSMVRWSFPNMIKIRSRNSHTIRENRVMQQFKHIQLHQLYETIVSSAKCRIVPKMKQIHMGIRIKLSKQWILPSSNRIHASFKSFMNPELHWLEFWITDSMYTRWSVSSVQCFLNPSFKLWKSDFSEWTEVLWVLSSISLKGCISVEQNLAIDTVSITNLSKRSGSVWSTKRYLFSIEFIFSSSLPFQNIALSPGPNS